jgi:hypothetical protein
MPAPNKLPALVGVELQQKHENAGTDKPEHKSQPDDRAAAAGPGFER